MPLVEREADGVVVESAHGEVSRSAEVVALAHAHRADAEQLGFLNCQVHGLHARHLSHGVARADESRWPRCRDTTSGVAVGINRSDLNPIGVERKKVAAVGKNAGEIGMHQRLRHLRRIIRPHADRPQRFGIKGFYELRPGHGQFQLHRT